MVRAFKLQMFNYFFHVLVSLFISDEYAIKVATMVTSLTPIADTNILSLVEIRPCYK